MLEEETWGSSGDHQKAKSKACGTTSPALEHRLLKTLAVDEAHDVIGRPGLPKEKKIVEARGTEKVGFCPILER
jgi:hypothetical protein